MDPRVFAFSGFARPVADEMRRRVAQLGGRSLRNLTKDVSYFVIVDKGSHPNHPRMVRARELGIKILSADEFWRQFGSLSSSTRTSATRTPQLKKQSGVTTTSSSKKSMTPMSILFYPSSGNQPMPVRRRPPTTRDAWIAARRRVVVALKDFSSPSNKRRSDWEDEIINRFHEIIDEIDLLLYGRQTHVYRLVAPGRNERHVPDESINEHLAGASAKLMYGRTLWRKTRRARSLLTGLRRDLRSSPHQ